jgi:ubiquinone/menaquinone biosynthesis C-methylase UbiE
MNELKRLKRVYKKRIASKLNIKYSLFNVGELYMLQRREFEVLSLLKKSGIVNLLDLKILEIGCGCGHRIADFQRWGASAHNLYGIDYLNEFVVEAKKNYSAYKIFQASGHDLPFEDESFDIVMQSTVFSSILNNELRSLIAKEMLRVLKSDGIILWYDFRYPNPFNSDVIPMKKADLIQLFGKKNMLLKLLTLIPPVARKFSKISFTLCRLLEAIPIFRSHYLAIIKKN